MTQLFYSAEKQRQAFLTQQRQRSQRLSSLSPEQAAFELNRHCPYCGQLLTPYPYDYQIGGRDIRQWLFRDTHGCPPECEAQVSDKVQLDRETREKGEAQIQAMLRRVGLIGWLGRATFDNFELRPDWPEAVEVKSRAMAYCTGLINDTLPRSKNWLILYGNVGGGKSHLAAAIIQHMYLLKPPSYFRVWPDYLDRIKASWNRERYSSDSSDDSGTETEADIARELQNGKVVVIDDLDKKAATEWTKSTLYSVLNYRYNAELPTILTFNYGLAESDPKAPGRLALEAYLGRAVLDRVIGATFDIIEFTGPSYRSKVIMGAK